ncbi:sister chromatid cohesion protein PDS5 A isoform X1 [Tripterygium wilfordii]|uniref:Sister chromatid cohesion protein PDS5 A isoform X1 n=1 Tax=Tripterygium wilfordii TaxID=458696 RepID=A0A7J7D8Y6_TRIWF|nr:sister chromatid cohesion protein PDS5 homolog A-like isoform X2 [Tripterygium wilfordii]KAF5742835.1 sister chromatid cohesion protein PDS5 A isoform X1 [Tripterygium wilfordii]
MAQKLQQQLKEVGSKLETPPSSKDALIKLLKQAAASLLEIEQSRSASELEPMQLFLNSIVKPELLKHHDKDVKLLVATCICEITRITAPNAPYNDDVLKDIFHLIVGTFSGLSDAGGPSFGRRVVILETLAKYRSCVVMLDLECDDLVNKMFTTFFTVARDDHQESVLSSMQTIMILLLEESEEIREDLLLVILSVLGRNKHDMSAAARRLAMNIIENCAGKLEVDIKQYLISSMSGDRPANSQIDYHEVIYDIYRCAPQILFGVVPYLTGELLTDQLDTRLKGVRLVGDLFALPGSSVSEAFRPIFLEFLKRLSDRVVVVRMTVLERVRSCLLTSPSRAETPEIISALCDRLLDYDENVRKEVVSVISDMACHALDSTPVETVKLVAERLRDKSLLVKKYAMERLAEIFRTYCMRCSDCSTDPGGYDWIPGKILRCFYDKDFRSDVIESVLCGCLFPTEFSIKDIVKCWVRVFSRFDRVEVKALEKIMEQKQRLQQEMQRYLSLRQMYQDGDASEIQKKVMFCFRIMSRSFSEPSKAEENFNILDQLKDANIWKILTNLLDPNTSFQQASTSRDDLLKILGEKHRLYDFLSNLSMKCSYLLFNKEHVKEILLEAAMHKTGGHTQDTQSCMDLLVILARFGPFLLSGVEEQLVTLLKDDNEITKEGILHVLARAGGTIREQLAASSSSIDLILERLCLEGTRRQAKYAVHALAAITKDDGLKSLSILYKRLVDLLEEKTHLPAVLQSLGCIAQTAMPVFETRESEIQEFIRSKILGCHSKEEDDMQASWDDRSENCLLKIYGIKTLVKSYLPVKDAQLRPNIDDLIGTLRSILSFGEISKETESSPIDKAHLRLAAAKAVLRLSRHWDSKIPVDVFHLTLRTPEIPFPQARKLFLNKVHNYIKDRLLDVKYACAFLFNKTGSKPLECEEEKQNLVDIIQMQRQAKARHLSLQNDANSLTSYPEYILPFLVHVLAHHSCPNVDECKDVKAFELLYQQLHVILSMLLQKDEDVMSEASTNKEKESICAVISIFQSIKCSEDIVDVAISKNSHAICDLGLSITKRFFQKDDDLQKLTATVSLPAMLYKPIEKTEGDESLASGGQTWLADENVLSHFESLKLETEEGLHQINTETAEDEILKDSEIEGSEVPLGKIIKRLKSQGAKAGKAKMNKSSPTEENNDDVDILKMVREINFDNLDSSSKFESSNGHKHIPKPKIKSDPDHKKVGKRKASGPTSIPVPKRRRSSGYFRSPNSTSKDSLQASAGALPQARVSPSEVAVNFQSDSGDKNSMPTNLVESTESDLLVSCIRKNRSVSSKHKSKVSDFAFTDKANEDGETDDSDMMKPTMESDQANTTNDVKSPSGSTKKRKRRSVAGLAKCTTKKAGIDIENLIGCSIKVWWPMDKQFYEGIVKSYDPIKRKHVVKYEDGDVEVLRLERERWNLVDNDRKSTKKPSSSKRPVSTGVASVRTQKTSGGSRQDKKSIKLVKGKRTPKKNLKHGQKSASKSNFSEAKDKGDSDLSNPEPSPSSKSDYVKSGDMRGEHTESVDDNPRDVEESDKEVTSTSGEALEVRGMVPSQIEESDGEEKSESTGKVDEPIKGSPQDAKDHDAQEEFLSEGKEADESNGASTESDEDEPDFVEKEYMNPRKSDMELSSLPDVEDAEISDSDDEPLSKWKNKVGKSRPKQ